jgi:protein-S-isoprenylcysteine O-methyltransferase Ste14
MNSPAVKGWIWLVGATFAIGLVIFASAWTLQYWQAWAYLAVIFVCSVPVTLFMISDPALLESRTKIGPGAEQRPIQRLIVLVLFVPTIAEFVLPGLDHRFGWSRMPAWLSIAGDGLIAASIAFSDRVFRANAFGAATVQVAADQKVISTGPYAIVRNPMYSGAVVFFIGMALALGSWWALIPATLTIPCFAWRLSDEESLLAQSLPGYTDYQAKVRWRLIPGVY